MSEKAPKTGKGLLLRLPSVASTVGVLQPLLPLSALILLLIHGMTAPAPERRPRDPSVEFQAAIADSAVRSDRNVYGGLIAVTPENSDLVWRTPDHQELKAVVFVTPDEADTYYRNPDGSGRRGTTPPEKPVVWVTLAPELQRFCRRLGLTDPSDRLKQHLGLNPNSKYSHLAEMWVTSDDLFRPCPDPEVKDSVCTLRSADPQPVVKNVPDYGHFLLELYERSYQAGASGGAPWTGLGYTYDWARGEHGIGASEFMLVPNANYEVVSVQSAASYCAAGSGGS